MLLPRNWPENILTAIKGLKRKLVDLVNVFDLTPADAPTWYEQLSKRGGPVNPGVFTPGEIPTAGEWASVRGLPDDQMYTPYELFGLSQADGAARAPKFTWLELLGMPDGAEPPNLTWMEIATKAGGLGAGDLTFWEKFHFNYTLEGAGVPDTPYDFMKRAVESIENGGAADGRLLDIFNAVSLLNLNLGSLDATMGQINTTLATELGRIATATESIDAKTP